MVDPIPTSVDSMKLELCHEISGNYIDLQLCKLLEVSQMNAYLAMAVLTLMPTVHRVLVSAVIHLEAIVNSQQGCRPEPHAVKQCGSFRCSSRPGKYLAGSHLYGSIYISGLKCASSAR